MWKIYWKIIRIYRVNKRNLKQNKNIGGWISGLLREKRFDKVKTIRKRENNSY